MEAFEWLKSQLWDLTLISTFARLSLAVLFGGLIGMERGRRRRAAGMRTHILVCMGATLVMLTNQYISMQYNIVDPSRMGAQVISGIGFLGVGTIIVDRQQQVRGLTTAAGLWTCACMGLAIGVGFYAGALMACVFIMATITILDKLEDRVINKSRNMDVYVEFTSSGDISEFVNLAAENGINVLHLETVKPRSFSGDGESRSAAIISLQLPKRHLHSEVVKHLKLSHGLILIKEVFQQIR